MGALRPVWRMGQRLDLLLRMGADMTAPNGWPGKPGVPLHPEKDGWHWLLQVNGQYPEVWEWASGPAEYGAWCESQGDGQPKEIAKWFHYLGPVLTPDEVQNLRDDLASVERERAHQHGRADRSAAEHAREQAKREALQKRVAELEEALRAIKNLALTTHQLSKYRANYLRIIDAALKGKKDE